MFKFDVMPNSLIKFAGNIDGYSQILRSIGRDVEDTRCKLEFSEEIQKMVSYRLRAITQSAYQESAGCADMAECLTSAVHNYRETEEQISGNAKIIWEGIAEIQRNRINSAKIGKEVSGYKDNSDIDSNLDLNGDDTEKRIKDIVKALLGIKSKAGDNKADKERASAAKSFISYMDSLDSFFTGDKAGMTGVTNFLGLTSDSVGFWDSLYNLAKVQYEPMIKAGKGVGLFSPMGVKGAGCISFVGDTIGLFGKVMDTVTGEYDNAWEAAGEYLGIGGDVFKTGQSGKEFYDLMNNVDKVSKSKGLYSEAGLWVTFADTCFSTLSQVSLSIGEYSADGKWTMEDTAATMIDSSVSGLYAIIEGLSFGLLSESTTGVSAKDISNTIQENAKKMGRDIGNFIVSLRNDPISALIDASVSGIYDMAKRMSFGLL